MRPRDRFRTAQDLTQRLFDEDEARDKDLQNGRPLEPDHFETDSSGTYRARCLEIALRYLLTWRRRITAPIHEHSSNISMSARDAQLAVPQISAEDYLSFNMLVWLGVMCDTTSSGINRRPLVISDLDTALKVDRSFTNQRRRATGTSNVCSTPTVHGLVPNSTLNLWGTSSSAFEGRRSMRAARCGHALLT